MGWKININFGKMVIKTALKNGTKMHGGQFTHPVFASLDPPSLRQVAKRVKRKNVLPNPLYRMR